MTARSLAAALSLLALAALPALAQDKPKAPAGAPDNAEMEAFMKASTPGEQHKQIARLVGDWTFTNRAWMAPGQPPMESTGTIHAETILGGRYVHAVWQGSMMGMPFEGRETDGYDNVAKQYVSTWMDNMGTGIMQMKGTCEDNGKKCTSKGETMDAMTGKPSYMRSVVTWTGTDSFTNEMYGPGPDGKETKMMEIVAKRK